MCPVLQTRVASLRTSAHRPVAAGHPARRSLGGVPQAMTLKSHALAHIRGVVLAGHAGSGKTTLAEQLLFRASAIPRLGRVDDGTAHLDYEPEEQKQHRSLSLAVGTFERGEHEITLVDTPGYPDFVAEMVQGFHAADAALFVMDAAGGVEAGGGAGRGKGGGAETPAPLRAPKRRR